MTTLHLAEQWSSAPSTLIEALLPRGPKPRRLSVQGLLVGMFLAKEDGRPLHLRQVEKALKALPPRDKTRLGIPLDITYRQVERLFNVIIDVVDPEPVQIRGRSQKPPMILDDQIAAQREQLRDLVIATLLESSIPDQYKSHGSYAVDWTDVDTWARGRKTGGFQSDPTARWNYRRPKGPHTEERYYGFREQVLTMVHDDGGPEVPELVRSLSITHAKKNQPNVALDMLRQLKARGITPGDLLADKEYPSKNGWMLAVRTLGFDPVVDVSSKLLGRGGLGDSGELIVDDLILCPAIPNQLVDILPRPKQKDPEAVWQAYFRKTAEREKYAFKPNQRIQPDGFQQFKCPAETGTCICPHKPRKAAGARQDAAKIYQPPVHKAKCCTQTTINVAPKGKYFKTRQKHRFYSADHQASYERRTAVERSFAFTKDKAGVEMTAGSIRMMGATKHLFLRTIGYVVLNYRTLERFDQYVQNPKTRRPKARKHKLFVLDLKHIRARPPARTRR